MSKTYACQCGKEFTTKGGYERHYRPHPGYKAPDNRPDLQVRGRVIPGTSKCEAGRPSR